MPYREEVERRYNEVYGIQYNILLDGRNTESAKESAERGAQHEAMLITFDEMYDRFRHIENAAAIWNAIYAAHLKRKAGNFSADDLNEDIIDKVLSGAQSWKKCSGHVFEHYIVEKTHDRLARYNIEFVLQKRLTSMLQNNEIANDDEDNIQAMASSDDFDIYALVNVNGNNLVFGCVQAKTSIRDRVGRDRDFSIPVMERHFWSAAVVLDGAYLAMPKFNKMVNGGGTTQYSENGWHGMYSMSNIENCDRIYKDEDLDILVEHAHEASQKFTSARQRFDRYWRALNNN
ncbi:MAG: hypothetical protein K6E85_07245 [Lachnospiraceae bacterium]|nr:hypothetical protein [Lachnospiraceae bacterium]